jgi:ABC-type multidrug transport system fused ATPase/permease subunit
LEKRSGIFNVSRIRRKWQSSTLGRSARVLTRKDQKRILLVIVAQIFMGLVDLVGVALIGVLGALAVNGVQSKEPGNRVNSVLNFFHLGDQSFQTQAAVIGVAATLLLVTKTVLSVIFARRILFFLSRRSAFISSSLISKLLSQSLLTVQARTTQETTYALTTGVNTITMGVLATTVNAVSDISVLAIMTIGLFIVDPVIAFGTLLTFGAIGGVMYLLLHNKARRLGIQDSNLSILSHEKISEVLLSYRESVVRNRRDYYAREIGGIRYQLSDVSAEISFLPNISKYVVEITVILGALIISGVQFMLQDATQAVSTLSVFLAAGTRIAPAALRLQQSAIQIKGSLGNANITLELIDQLGDVSAVPEVLDHVDTKHDGFIPSIDVSGLDFSYPLSEKKAVREVNLEVKPGSFVAVVGSSGAGKTTLIDLLLGVIRPDTGSVLISNFSPQDAVNMWPGAIGYVPQDVSISNGTIRENIALGYPIESASDDLVNAAITVAQLNTLVDGLELGLESEVGEKGSKLSGGQRQRLGIARAMFTKPKLLVMDEATSALDGQTELNISDAIQQLRGNVTVIMIAHRLSTVRNADQVIYMADGKIEAFGTFDQVRQQIPDFDSQAKLMGL